MHNKKKNKYIFYLMIILFFILSIGIRYENIFERPLIFYTDNDDATSHVLVTMKALDEVPYKEHKFLPIFTLKGDYNKYIDDLPTASAMDQYGNVYYTSFPPFGFIAPYIFFKAFSLDITPVNIRLFNLFIHFISILFIFEFIILLLKVLNRKENYFVAFLGSMIYLFSLEALWSHSIVYWHHSLVQPIWLFMLILFLRGLRDKKYHYVCFFILNFILDYTEWTGYIISGTFFVASAYLYLKNREDKFKKLSWITGLSSILSGVVMILHFSLNIEIKDYFSNLFFRAGERGFEFTKIIGLLSGYKKSFGPFIILSLVLGSCVLFKFKKEKKIPKYVWLILFLTLTPLVENILMLNHATVYTFDRLKLIIPLITMICIFIEYLGKRYYKVISLFITLCIILSIFNYYDTYTLDRFTKTYLYQDKNFGEFVKKNVSKDEIAFVNKVVRGDQIFYSDRNIVERTYNIETVKEFLEKRNYKKGKLILVGGKYFDDPNQELYYGNVSCVVSIDLDKEEEDIRLYPAKYSDASWENGISRTTLAFFVHNAEVLSYFKIGDTLKNQNGKYFRIQRIEGNNVYLESESTLKELRGSIYFDKI